MNDAVLTHSLFAFTESACAALWRGSWQAGLTVVAIWAISRAFPRLPAAARCWLWRLALLKFALTLLAPFAAIPLPLLPKASAPTTSTVPAIAAPWLIPPVSLPGTNPAVMPVVTTDASPQKLSVLRSDLVAKGIAPVAFDNPERLALSAQTAQATRTTAEPFLPRVLALASFVAFALYLVGVALCLTRLAGCGWQTRRFLQNECCPLDDAGTQSDAAALCRRLGIVQVPRLKVAAEIAASQLIAAFPPVVLLPRERTDREARRLMLAHELAHLRRGDLIWSGLAALAHTLFFFHPLVWLARREEELAREMACDAVVLAITDASPMRYGTLLVEAAAPQRAGRAMRGSVASLGIANEIAQIRRRIIALQTLSSPESQRRLRVAVSVASAAGLLALVPWRVVAAGHSVGATTAPLVSLVGLPDAAGNGVVEGRVLLLPDNEGGANCTVHLDATDAHMPWKPVEITTDVEGHFRFTGVPAGTYQLWVQPNRNLLPSSLAGVPDKSSLRVTVGANPTTPLHQDLLLSKDTIAVIGRVTDGFSQSVEDAEVGAGSLKGGPQSVVIWQPVSGDGHFHLDVGPGMIGLYVRYGRPKGPGIDTTPRFYPYRLIPEDGAPRRGALDFSRGHSVEVALDIDAHYCPAPDALAPIAGTVVGADGHPVARAEVYVFNVIRTIVQQRFPARPIVLRADDQGKFKLEGIPANWAGNRLDIRARDPRQSGDISQHLMVTVPAKGAALAPVVLPLVHGLGATLTGRVMDVTGRPAAYVPVDLQLGIHRWELLAMSYATITDSQGYYHFTGLWPDMEASVWSAPDVKRYGNMRDRHGYFRFLTFAAGKTTTQPTITLKPTTGQISGRLVTSNGRPDANGTFLICFGADPQSGMNMIHPDAEGRFRFDNLGIGPHRIEARSPKSRGSALAPAGERNVTIVMKPVTIRPRRAKK